MLSSSEFIITERLWGRCPKLAVEHNGIYLSIKKMGVIFEESLKLTALFVREAAFPLGPCVRRQFATGGIEAVLRWPFEMHDYFIDVILI